jgi:hypothetical protein
MDLPHNWTRAGAVVAFALCVWFYAGDYPGLFGSCDYEPDRDAQIAAWHSHWHIPFLAALALAAVCLSGWLRALWLSGRGRLLLIIAAGAVAGCVLTPGVLLLAAYTAEVSFAAPLVLVGLFALTSRLSARRSSLWEIAAVALVLSTLMTLAVLGQPSPLAFAC